MLTATHDLEDVHAEHLENDRKYCFDSPSLSTILTLEPLQRSEQPYHVTSMADMLWMEFPLRTPDITVANL